eukprot:scaffold56484_cov61-Attheya_sp.AAC.4
MSTAVPIVVGASFSSGRDVFVIYDKLKEAPVSKIPKTELGGRDYDGLSTSTGSLLSKHIIIVRCSPDS